MRGRRSDDARLARARLGIGGLFASNAIVFASIVPHYPELKDRFALDDLAFGVLIGVGPVGSLIGSALAGLIVAKVGAPRVAVLSTLVLASMLAVVGWGDSLWGLILAIFIIGCADATGDVANNSHALELQNRLNRSIISGFHGVWSIGAIIGAVVAFLTLVGGVPIGVHLAAVAVVLVLVSVAAIRFLPLPDSPAVAATEPRAVPNARFVVLWALAGVGSVAAAGAFLEDLGSTWGGILLIREGSLPSGFAGSAFLASMTALAAGRLVGDRVVDRWGPAATVRAGAIVAFSGLVLLGLVAHPGAVLLGFALVGVGIATAIPLAMDAANRIPGLPAGAGLAATATIMRVGFLLSPVIVGAISSASTLQIAILVAAVGLVPLFVAPHLRSSSVAGHVPVTDVRPS